MKLNLGNHMSQLRLTDSTKLTSCKDIKPCGVTGLGLNGKGAYYRDPWVWNQDLCDQMLNLLAHNWHPCILPSKVYFTTIICAIQIQVWIL